MNQGIKAEQASDSDRQGMMGIGKSRKYVKKNKHAHNKWGKRNALLFRDCLFQQAWLVSCISPETE